MIERKEKIILLREYLGRQWTNEFLTYPFSAKPGECHADSIVLHGSQGSMPVQLSQIACWPETQWVKSGELSLVADLAPLAENKYTVRFGPVPNNSGPHATDLRSSLIAAKDRSLFRAQMAHLGYVMADPATWSIERGFRTYNLNMSVAYVLNQGLVACTIPSHPEAPAWMQPALRMMDDMLNEAGTCRLAAAGRKSRATFRFRLNSRI